MNEATADATRATVEVFVAAPTREIDIPFVQLQRHVTNGMSQIKANQAAKIMTNFGDLCQVEKLTGIVLDTAEHDQSRLAAMCTNGL